MYEGLKDLGEILLSKFKWGSAFYDVNREILDQYAACETANDVSSAEKHHLDNLKKSSIEGRLRGEYYSLPLLFKYFSSLGAFCN